jgi:hypothetical protein
MKAIVGIAVCLAALQSVACFATDTVPQPRAYEGMSCVSAAVALTEDTFIAASGRDNVLRIYRTTDSPAPVPHFDISDFLGLHGEPADIRGAAKIADRIYWITSHSRDEDGRIRPGRYRFFATTIRTENGKFAIEPVGKPCATLLDKLPNLNTVSTLRLDKAMRLHEELSEKQRRKLAPTSEGLNIEALGADPRIDTLFIGFRNPRPVRVTTGRPNALVVPLNNASEVVEKGKEPIFGEAMLWDFDGLGITSIEYSPIHEMYFIVAQPPDDAGPCVLYRWSGMKANPPEQVCRLSFTDKEAADVTLVPFENARKLLLLTGRSDGIDAVPQEKHFQGVWIQP